MATQEQLANRLKTQLFTVDLPTAGIFRDTSGGTSIFRRTATGVESINFTDLLVPESERAGIGNFGAQQNIAKQRLKEQFGFDFEDLPQFNIADVAQGKDVSGSTAGLESFLSATPAQSTQEQINTQSSQLVEGQVDTTTPELSQFGTFDRQLEFGMKGEDVKRLQQFLNASGFTVAKEGEAGSVGNETDFFGPATQKALQEYQKSQGIVSKGDPTTTGFGRLGPQTLQAVNTLTTTQQPSSPTGDISPTGGGSGASGGGILPDTPNPELDSALDDLLNNSNITDDQKDVARKLYDVISRNDKEQADRMAAAFEASIQFSDPFFKAQIAMTIDSLTRSLTADEGDLEFSQTQLRNALNDLQEDISSTKGQLDFTKEQQLKGLEKSYIQDLETNAQNLASVGKTRSSVRGKTEQLLREEKEGLVESTQRKFNFETGQLERQGTRGVRDTQAQLKQLQDEATQKRIASLRSTEEKVGSERLSGLGFGNLLGDVGGSIERSRIQDALSFSGNAGFVF